MLTTGQVFRAVMAAAALIIGLAAAEAADLYGGRGGSIKDDNMPVLMRAPAGPCYMRADVGYSFSGTPDVTWPVTDGFGNFMGDKVSNVEVGNTWLVEGGFGCGTAAGGSGWRGELMFGYRGERKIDGEPLLWAPPNVALDDPLHTRVSSYTMMLNAYRDLGNFGRFMPYVGAGIGMAYHTLGNVSFTDNPFLVNQIEGKSDLAFAWQLMAGVGYRMTENTVLDLGYRYADLGKATSGRADTAGFVNPRVVVDDITAHEIKIGVRYQFGAADAGPMPLK